MACKTCKMSSSGSRYTLGLARRYQLYTHCCPRPGGTGSLGGLSLSHAERVKTQESCGGGVCEGSKSMCACVSRSHRSSCMAMLALKHTQDPVSMGSGAGAALVPRLLGSEGHGAASVSFSESSSYPEAHPASTLHQLAPRISKACRAQCWLHRSVERA